MRTIHKHVLRDELHMFATHEGARVVHVGNQHENITVWFEVDTDQPDVAMTLHVVGTGHPIPEEADQHLGTAVMAGGRLVFHVYSHRRVL